MHAVISYSVKRYFSLAVIELKCSEYSVGGNRWFVHDQCFQRKSKAAFLKSFVSRCWEDHDIQHVDRRSEHH